MLGIKLIALAHSQTVIFGSGMLLHEAVKWKFQLENRIYGCLP